MADQRNISIEISKRLLDQIQKRAKLNGRSRNAEFRYLLRMGLDLVDGEDFQMRVPTDDQVKSTVRIGHEMEMTVSRRCKEYERKMGPELVRVVAHAIQVRTDREIQTISDMMSRQGQAGRDTPPPEQP
jgi:plasmid stability protein